MSHRRKLPPRLLPPSHRPAAEGRPDAKKQRREEILYWSTVLSGLGAIATILFVAITLAGQSSSDSSPRAGAPAITQAYVRNGAEEVYVNGNGGEIQTLASSPTIELLLFNGSTRHVLVEGTRITIESYAHLDLCISPQGGGPIPEPHPYVIRLPSFPLPSEDLIGSHLHDEIDPESGDRIALRFAAPPPTFEGYGLYRLGVQLQIYGSSKLLNAGRFVLSTPAKIPPYDGYLPEDNAGFRQFVSGDFRSSRLSVTWCMRRNLASLLSILSGPGKRSPELALLDHPVLASHWGQLQNYIPPHSAALQLLHHKQAELAVFAASQTGDRAFAERVRRHAVEQLLGEAEKQLATADPSQAGEYDVRVALRMQPSSRAQEMLTEFQRRLASRGA